MISKKLPVIAAAALLAMASCTSQVIFPRIDQGGRTAIVAHRGYWNCDSAGFAENSIASLACAQKEGFWGSEFDVHITTDDVLLVFHNDSIDGKRLDCNPYSEFAGHRLANGEKIPTLDEYLSQGEKCPSTMLVCELKPQIDTLREDALLEHSVAALKAHGLFSPDRVLFISFSRHICERIAKEYPGFVNQYLDKYLGVEDLYSLGINGFDFEFHQVYGDSTAVSRAHALGMSTNAWTVNKPEDMLRLAALGIDAITTNEPLLLRSVLAEKEYRK